ncbi:ABC transporter substrate-binding protein [Caballeronia sp. AZ10_KS36]|uniref:ABC transporter substrate-binding protein n=1 Tax=Caballeronia sp. AZ10_KS36 TaxID=2921757 RepID=UPI0020292D46|nr:ABC transporter substrate-binding protein [Caballeronia sp. AZ10_KS36]
MHNKKLKHIARVAATLALAAATSTAHAQAAAGDTSKAKIALSNNYAGNSWRQAMLKSWNNVSTAATKAGVIAGASAFTTSGNQITEQAQQVQNLILQGYKAIAIDAASPTALNGVIKQACDAGIVVVSFDGIVTEPCAYRVVVDYKKMGEMQLDYLSEKVKSGNLLEIRGIAGSSIDEQIHGGIASGLQKHSGFRTVGAVYGNWTQTVAQKEVTGILPTLPKIDAIVTQGGDGYGAAQAFKAAGRPVPVIIMGNRYEELDWWKQQSKDGYQTMSVSIAPGISTFAFWVAQQVLAGKKIPHDVIVPLVTVEQSNLDDMLKKTQPGGVTNVEYTRDDVVKLVDSMPKH